MKTTTLRSLFALLLLVNVIARGQEPVIRFTAVDNANWTQLDSIKVINRTIAWDCDTMLYYPDTILYLPITGINENNKEQSGFKVFQNYPNPVLDKTGITVFVPQKGNVSITISDITGRKLIGLTRILDKGYHSFSFEPGEYNICFFTATWKSVYSGIKIINLSSGKQGPGTLTYKGTTNLHAHFKAVKSTVFFSFSPGDTLLCVGYTDTLESGIENSPGPGDLYTFQFAHNIPCPGTPTVYYEGQTYNTVQIFSQCWMKENLNVGTMINGLQDAADNDTIEKYCSGNIEAGCSQYGGLYSWNEMMNYTTNEGARGICPPGWHIPSDDEWKILEGAVDSQYGIGDQEWDYLYYTGYDVGINLKSQNGWSSNGNGTDLFEFEGFPGGRRWNNGAIENPGGLGSWWTSTLIIDDYSAWLRYLQWNYSSINRHDGDINFGCSVRCIKNEEQKK